MSFRHLTELSLFSAIIVHCNSEIEFLGAQLLGYQFKLQFTENSA